MRMRFAFKCPCTYHLLLLLLLLLLADPRPPRAYTFLKMEYRFPEEAASTVHFLDKKWVRQA